MDSLNDTQFYVERRDYISDNFTTIFTETNEYYNALEEWMWRLEEKLGLSSKHGVVIFMLFYLILLLTLTLCVLCFYSCIIRRRHRLNSEKNKAEGRSNYTKNIQSFYSANSEFDDPEGNDEDELNFEISPIPINLMKDVLLQHDDLEESNLEETILNDDAPPVYDQGISGCSSSESSFHAPPYGAYHDAGGMKHGRNALSTFGGYEQHEMISFPNASDPKSEWVTFDDPEDACLPSDFLNDSETCVAEGESGAEMRQQLNEGDGLLNPNEKIQSSDFENADCIDVMNQPNPSPLNFSAIVASQLPS